MPGISFLSVEESQLGSVESLVGYYKAIPSSFSAPTAVTQDSQYSRIFLCMDRLVCAWFN
jgi:hypothetical protein